MISSGTVKCTNYLSWEEYFMGVAHMAALRSKDPVTKVIFVVLILTRSSEVYSKRLRMSQYRERGGIRLWLELPYFYQ